MQRAGENATKTRVVVGTEQRVIRLPVEKILNVSPTSPTPIKILIPSYFGDTDEDGGEEVGQLEIELKPGLTRRLNDCRQTVKRKLKEVNPKRKQLLFYWL